MIKDVAINVSKLTSPLSVVGFGMPLLLATNGNISYIEYESMEDVAADFASSTNVYKMASAIFSQDPCPDKIAVYGVSYTQTKMVRATLTTALTGSNNDIKYTSKIAGLKGTYIKIKYTNPGTDTASTSAAVTGTGTSLDPYVIDVTLKYATSAIAATAADVMAAINANASAKALVKMDYDTSNDGTGVVTALAATSLAGGSDGSDASTLTDALDTLIKNNNDWYYLVCDMHDYNEIVALSSWSASNDKQYFAVTKDDNLCDFEVINSDNTVLFYHTDDDKYPDCALVGMGAASTPGEITWKFKTLVGVAVVAISDTRVAELHGHHVNTYVSKYGKLQTSEGLCSSGEYIDVMVGSAWVTTQLAQEVSLLLYTKPKIPYDNKGIGLVVSTMINIFRDAATNGIIAKDDSGKGLYSVTAPKKADILTSNIATRKLKNVKYNYTIEGAVHDVTINGVISY